MTVSPDRHFYSVKEAAELLGVDSKTVCEAINTGRLKALRIGVTLAGARIPRSEIFREAHSNDLQTRRIRRMLLDARDKQYAADQLKASWSDAQRIADEAYRAVEYEFALDELETVRDQGSHSLIAN